MAEKEVKTPNSIAEFAKLMGIKGLNAIPASEEAANIDKVKAMVDQIQRIDTQYADIKSNNIDAFDYYFGKNYMTDADGRSQVYTTDLADTIEWVMPSLVRIFAGGDDVTSLSPRRKEYAKQVENHNELINYQIKVKNKWFIAINDWFKDALLLKRGAVKYQWFTEKERREKDYQSVTEEEFQSLKSDPNAISVKNVVPVEVTPETVQYGLDEMGNPTVVPVPAVNMYDCTIEYEYTDEYPLVEAVPAEEYGFPVDTRDIEDCSFFFHRVTYDKWKFIQRFGKDAFDKVEELKGTFLATGDAFTVTEARFGDVNGAALDFFYNTDKQRWVAYECFYRDEDTGDPWLRTICGDVLLEDKANKYEKPPFELITPIKLSHRIIGASIFDLLKDLQRIRTALIRQMLDNVYFNNNGRTILDPTRISYEDFLNANRPGGVVRTLDGNPANEQGLFPIPTPQMPQWVFEVYESINKEKDYHTGVPRSFQGVNPQVLNKTYRGQNEQIAQAQQRIEMMARLFAEMGVAPLIRDFVDMNALFLKKEIAIKVVNDWTTVTPEDVVAKADVIINVGLGTQSKGELVQQDQQYIALYLQLYPIFGNAIIPNILHAMGDLTKAMGNRDVQNWVPGEDDVQAEVKRLEQLRMLQGLSKNKGGANTNGTQPGQQMNAQPAQPGNPFNPQTNIPDIYGGYFG